MQAADGILTAFGGASSHAALVSRQMGKVCIVGCSALQIDYDKGTVTVGDTVLKEGDWISIDGFTGEVMAGQVATKPSEVVQVLIDKTLKPEQSKVYQQFAELMEWADAVRKLKIRTNADKPDQAAQAIAFGAEGIGLCRTEHMFFDHIERDARDDPGRDAGGPQEGAGQAAAVPAAGLRGPVPGDEGPAGDDPHARSAAARVPAARRRRARRRWPRTLGVSPEKIAERVKGLHEFNPMLGFRGCRLGIVYPGDHRDAGPGHLRGRLQRAEGRHQGRAGDHDPAGRLPARTEGAGEDRPRHGREGLRRRRASRCRTWSAR